MDVLWESTVNGLGMMPAKGTCMNCSDDELQAAVDYVTGLGGGTVEIGPGTYTMHDSLHLRPRVTVRGAKGKTLLKKGPSAVSALALDGDFGEQQMTLREPADFAVGYGVAIWDDRAGGFHTTTARITGGRGNYFMELSHYEEVPVQLQKKIIAQAVQDGRIREEEE